MRRILILMMVLAPTLLAATDAAAQSRSQNRAMNRAINRAMEAKNEAIEALAGKYAQRDGFSTTVIKGDLSRGLAGSLDIESLDISNILRDISSIVVVRSQRPDSVFTREVSEAVSRGYSTVLSSNDGDDRVRFLLSESCDEGEEGSEGREGREGREGGKSGDRKEFVILITGSRTNMVVSIVGDYTPGK